MAIDISYVRRGTQLYVSVVGRAATFKFSVVGRGNFLNEGFAARVVKLNVPADVGLG